MIIDPEDYFADWHFAIRPELWPALGVTRREYIDREKTKLLRATARSNGESDTMVARLKVTYMAYSVDTNPVYTFEEGDTFYSMCTAAGLQISKHKELIEVWALQCRTTDCIYYGYDCKYTYASQMTATEIAGWLKTGNEPINRRIDRNQSWSEIAKYSLFQDTA